MRWTAALSVLLLSAGRAAELPNGGFEDGPLRWAFNDHTSQVLPAAARGGRLGLRVGSLEYNPDGASVASCKLPVTPGETTTVTFAARATAACSGVYLQFTSAAGKEAPPAEPKAQLVWLPRELDGQWHDGRLSVAVPPTAAWLNLWVHSFAGSAGLNDYDDFQVSGGLAAGEPVPPVERKPRLAPEVDLSKLPPRAQPAAVILKLDDFRLVRGEVPEVWQRLATLFAQRGVQAGYGVLAESLASATPAAREWMRQQQAAGTIEFWFHGWTHQSHTVAGQACSELFKLRPEEATDLFARSQAAARLVLGQPFRTFGPPGGPSPSFDATIGATLAADPDLRVFLYPQPLDDAGRALVAASHVKILDRAWQANLESAVGVPHYRALVAGYAALPERPYFVLQGHPPMWSGGRYDEFLRILDFLVAQRVEFVTPAAYALGP
ncbi:MAG: polysaccharide deacetylase family protein [Fimbriimonadaceae bacterium]|nr:polysaccharide deacetylase family protein [Fimbriimonadaceae bacterium]